MSKIPGCPPAHGLYDPKQEHDACGIGFIVDLKGRKSNQILPDALTILRKMDHRGACGCDPNTGDGAGVLFQIPDAFLRSKVSELGFELPEFGSYGVGMVFLPQDDAERTKVKETLERIAVEEGQTVLGWRRVPTDNSPIGESAREVEPIVEQIFIGRGDAVSSPDDFECHLYLILKRAEHAVRESGLKQQKYFYISSLSCRTIIYKGMLTPDQVHVYYPDLTDPGVLTALAMVHSRFSTNTFPSWDLAQPFRYLSHNGEINTVRGNLNWMRAREKNFACENYTPEELKRMLPVIFEQGSDSAILDNALHMMVMGGRSLAHAIMMMIPEAWAKHESMSQEKKDFYAYHACLMEPWDGPASVAFTDGTTIGAVLDRNGLRPSRYYVTKDDRVIMASEVGVLDVPPENVASKGRLQPGRMFLVNMKEGRIVSDEELKHQLATQQPYGTWLKDNLVALEDLPEAPSRPPVDHDTVLQRQLGFGYTVEDLKTLVKPMAENGKEAIGSMGTDTPLAVLSEKPQMLYNYFHQLFAQVTNPPLDAIREELVTDVGTTLGAEGNLLVPDAMSCRHIKLNSPILANPELDKLQQIDREGFKSIQLPILFSTEGVQDGSRNVDEVLDAALKALCSVAEKAINDGYNLLILTDRGMDEARAPIPALLASSCVHHHLVQKGLRAQASLILESGEPREVHQFAVLLGFGVDAINPYLAFETLSDLLRSGVLSKDLDYTQAKKNYIKALDVGIVKVMSKMGISTVQSYRGAQIFEAIGLNQELIDRYFTYTPTRVEGIGLSEIAEEQLKRHRRAFATRQEHASQLDAGGQYQWRRDGERHLFNPHTIHKLQHAVRTGNYKLFREYTAAIDKQSQALCTLRGLFTFKEGRTSIPIDEVESIEKIVRRFATGAMSYGSISKEAHSNLAIAMNRLGGWSNTGEGGEDVDRFTLDANGDNRCSAIKQVASGRFGVTSRYLVNARELQIKMAQGAKPGEGGQLPDHKVYPWIAKTRHSTPFVGLISPPPHHDIYSIEDLAQLIHDLKNSNRDARVSVKLVSEVGVGTVAAGVSKAHADVVLISGFDGGTGASPLTSIKHAGGPWELGLAEANQVLVTMDLRDRIVVQVDGQLKTGRDVVIGALLGAEEFGFATTALVASGCIMMRVCHLDTCPVGIATQSPELREKFSGKPEHVVNFMRYIAEEVREYMAELGFRTMDEMIGKVDVLDTEDAVSHWKAEGLDFSKILTKPNPRRTDQVGHQVATQDHGLEEALDHDLLVACKDAISEKKKVQAEFAICNTNRTVGTILGSEVTRKHPEGLPDDTIQLKFNGSAGQSFAAFVPKGITMEVEGDANDYVAKGLSGGRVIVYPPKVSTFKAEDNILIGNVAAYGATSGELFVRGIAGERFCVRNSGVHAVVEQVGDHCCEYMTGGCVVILGGTGRNFAAGMSGGVAFVLDEQGDFASRCNPELVELESVAESEDLVQLKSLLEKHHKHTGSPVAERLLATWDASVSKFVKVIPEAYKRALAKQKETREEVAAG